MLPIRTWSNFYGASIVLVTSGFVWAQTEKTITLTDVAPLDYDYLHPPKNSSYLNVTITISKISVRSIDESDMSFSVTIELWQSWDDFRLHYPPWASEGYQVLDSTWIHKIWNPKLYFINSVDGKLDNIISPSSFFWLSDTSKIYYCSRLKLQLICEMDLKYFPHDEQKCGIQMASAIYDTRDVKLLWSGTVEAIKVSSLQQFEVTKISNINFENTWGKNNLSCLELQLILRRRTGYYIINVYIPTILIVIMSMLTFWIPYDAVPARVTLGVTSLLTIITKQYQASLPNVSYIVALNIWLSSCIGFVFLSLLEFATVIALSTKNKKHDHILPHNHDLIPLVMLRANGTWSMKNNWSRHSKVTTLEKEKSSLVARRVDYFSRMFFPLSFIAFGITYWLYYN